MIRHVWDVLASGDPKAAEYIFRWTAWGFQHPGELAEVALALRGGKGSGKGVFGNAISRCFGEHALHIFYQNHLTGNFNGHLRSCLFLFADEAFFAGDRQGEGRAGRHVLRTRVDQRYPVRRVVGERPGPVRRAEPGRAVVAWLAVAQVLAEFLAVAVRA